jgi:hypothetical protein
MRSKFTNITSISRDPFARGDVVRETILPRYRSSCAWCGSRPGRFRYGWSDDGRPADIGWSNREFCSIDCHRSYNS